MDEIQLKQLTEFKQRTEREREDIGKRLLSPLTEVYEIDFGAIIGTLRFRRMNLEDRVKLANSGKGDDYLTVAAELLEKYSADKIPRETWLDMVKKSDDPNRAPVTGERAPEFVKIVMNLLALSAGGSEDGMMQFFRALETGLNNRSLMSIPTQNTTGTDEDGER
jgi:hypothetical protein